VDDPIVTDLLARPRLAALFAARPNVTVDDAIAELHTLGFVQVDVEATGADRAGRTRPFFKVTVTRRATERLVSAHGASLLEASCSCLEKALAAVEDECDSLIETCELLLATSSRDDLGGPQAR
jgi:hypothetical protein